MSLFSGEVHALVGENGAGKSTLIKILSGAIQQDAGEVWLREKRVEHNSPSEAQALGISVIYQEPTLFPDLTVAENIFLGRDSSRPFKTIDRKQRIERANALLNRVGARFRPDVLAGNLSMPEQQLMELAKALQTNASVVIMDEPTASLGNQDAENLFRIVAEMRSLGTAIVYISHRFEELFRLADRVTVLRDGQLIDTRPMSNVTSEELMRLMVGRDLGASYPKHNVQLGETVLDVKHLCCSRIGVSDAGLTVRRGQIVGLTGLVGSGRTQFAEILFGLHRPESGEIYLEGKQLHPDSPEKAIQAGIAYVPEDRRRHGVILGMSVGINATLAGLRQISARGFIDPVSEREAANDFIQRLQIKTPSSETLAGNLSGGNQQKVALARWLMTKPKVLILDEPTQGIDVGAKAEIYRLIGELAREGMAILIISSDMPEVLALSDRVAVMAKGRIASVLSREEATPYAVLELALGHARPISTGPFQ